MLSQIHDICAQIFINYGFRLIERVVFSEVLAKMKFCPISHTLNEIILDNICVVVVIIDVLLTSSTLETFQRVGAASVIRGLIASVVAVR